MTSAAAILASITQKNLDVESYLSSAMILIKAVSAPQGVSVEGKKTPVTMEESFSRLASSRISTEDRDVSLTYDLPTDPAWRRKHILLTHAIKLEQDVQMDANFHLSCVSEASVEPVSKCINAIVQEFSQMVTQVQEKPTDWYLNKTNCDEMSRQVKDAWMLAVERISSIVATVNTSRENVSHRIVNSEKNLQTLKALERADAALRIWDLDDEVSAADLGPPVSEEELNDFLTENQLELEGFLSSEEELLEFFDKAFGETPRQRQESMLLLQSALKAVSVSAKDILPAKPTEDMTANAREEFSKTLMESSRAALSEVASNARNRAKKHLERAGLFKAFEDLWPEANWEGGRGDEVRRAVHAENSMLISLKDLAKQLAST